MPDKKSIKKRNWKNITTVSAIITCILLSTFAFVKSGDVDNLTSGEDGGQLVEITEYGIDILWDHSSENHGAAVHGDLWIDRNNVYFIADSNEFGLEMYSWAHGQLTNEWIVIY